MPWMIGYVIKLITALENTPSNQLFQQRSNKSLSQRHSKRDLNNDKNVIKERIIKIISKLTINRYHHEVLGWRCSNPAGQPQLSSTVPTQVNKVSSGTCGSKLPQGQFPGNGCNEKDRECLFALRVNRVGTSVACRDKRVPTCYWRGCLQEWCGCCPCLPRAWCGHRRTSRQASLSGLAEWCPRGPETPDRGGCSDRLTVGSSQGPDNPPGHLEGQKQSQGHSTAWHQATWRGWAANTFVTIKPSHGPETGRFRTASLV